MGALRRFEFDTVFDAAGVIVAGDAEAQYVSREEVAELVREARQAGLAEGRAESARALASSVDALSTATELLLDRLHIDMHEAQAAFGALALAAARRIAGAALEAFGPEQAMALLDRALGSASTAPRLVIRAAPETLSQIHGPLTDAAASRGFAGALAFEPDAQMSGIRIDWGAGVLGVDPKGVERFLEGALSERASHTAAEDIA